MRIVEVFMTIDVVTLLRELDFSIAEGTSSTSWLLGAPDGRFFEVTLTVPTTRLNAHIVRNHSAHQRTDRRLLIGESATAQVTARAMAGQIDILTAEPIRLIHHGVTYATDDEPVQGHHVPFPRRPAWMRWAVERYLLLAKEPVRQPMIAAALGTSQQSVSNAVRSLGELVADQPDGFIAADRASMLEHWMGVYPGPGGQEFGWYSVDPIVEQVSTAVRTANLLGANPLVSGDVAADQLAPWKLPARGRIYLAEPVDLLGEGFVPAPVKEASLTTCVPRDPSIPGLAELHAHVWEPARITLADAAIVYWDVAISTDIDSAEAGEHLAATLIGDDS